MTEEPASEVVETPARVVAAVIRRAGAWLVCQRDPKKRYGGLWEFPGGKVEPGEDDTAALRRELNEELAVKVRRVGAPLFAVHDSGSLCVIVFREVEIDGNPIAREHLQVRWAPLEALRGLALAPGDRRFVDAMGRLDSIEGSV